MLDAPGQQAVNVFHPVRGVCSCFPIISVFMCFVSYLFSHPRASLEAQLVKNLPTVWETQVQFPRWDDPLEKGESTHSSILAGEFHRL